MGIDIMTDTPRLAGENNSPVTYPSILIWTAERACPCLPPITASHLTVDDRLLLAQLLHVDSLVDIDVATNTPRLAGGNSSPVTYPWQYEIKIWTTERASPCLPPITASHLSVDDHLLPVQLLHVDGLVDIDVATNTWRLHERIRVQSHIHHNMKSKFEPQREHSRVFRLLPCPTCPWMTAYCRSSCCMSTAL
jgi:hypothetical protein